MNKLFTLCCALLGMSAMANAQATDISWDVADYSSNSSITTTTVLGDFTIYASSDLDVQIEGNSKKIMMNGIETSYTYRLKTKGAGTFSEEDGSIVARVLAIDVTGSCQFQIAQLSSNGDEDHTFALATWDASTNTKTEFRSNITAYGSNKLSEDRTLGYSHITYEGDATTILIYSTNSGVNIYGINVIYDQTKWDSSTDSGEVPTADGGDGGDGGDAISSIKADGAVEVARYNVLGQKIEGEQKGVNIVKYSDGTTAKVLVK